MQIEDQVSGDRSFYLAELCFLISATRSPSASGFRVVAYGMALLLRGPADVELYLDRPPTRLTCNLR